MQQIQAGQIKAARAMLDWSREDLASATGLSLNTIRNLEMGYISPRGSTTSSIRRAIEEAGPEFIDHDGIRRRKEEIVIYQGPTSCEAFFNDVYQAVKSGNEEVLCSFPSSQSFLQLFTPANSAGSLTEFGKNAIIRCLLPEIIQPAATNAPAECRLIHKQQAGPVPYFIYGNTHAIALAEGGGEFRFIVFRSAKIARSYRDHFTALWETALPIQVSRL